LRFFDHAPENLIECCVVDAIGRAEIQRSRCLGSRCCRRVRFIHVGLGNDRRKWREIRRVSEDVGQRSAEVVELRKGGPIRGCLRLRRRRRWYWRSGAWCRGGCRRRSRRSMNDASRCGRAGLGIVFEHEDHGVFPEWRVAEGFDDSAEARSLSAMKARGV